MWGQKNGLQTCETDVREEMNKDFKAPPASCPRVGRKAPTRLDRAPEPREQQRAGWGRQVLRAGNRRAKSSLLTCRGRSTSPAGCRKGWISSGAAGHPSSAQKAEGDCSL